jgi:hypothetical protein
VVSVDRPGISQIQTISADGTSSRWLGELGHISGLKYSYVLPGGCDQMSCLLEVPPTARTPVTDPGRTVRIFRGASCVWTGKLDEPAYAAGGATVSAHGSGVMGSDFSAIYSTWDQNDALNQAISRGLPWVNTGIPATWTNPVTSVWLGQQPDSGSITITDYLNQLCTYGGLTWYVGRGNVLNVFPLPTTVTRLLVCTDPVTRTIAADVNALWLRYQTSADTATAATYATTEVSNPASIAAHGLMENYGDLSSAGTLTTEVAQSIGAYVLSRYNRANFAGPFTVRPGQLLTTGGVPVDLGCEQAGEVCRLILTDFAYGGEVTAAPITFVTGAYEYDEMTGTATVTPFQSVSASISSLLTTVMSSAIA